MKTLKQISKILSFPVLIIGTLLLLLYTTDIFPYLYRNTDIISTAIYRFLFTSELYYYDFGGAVGSLWIWNMLISLLYILLLLLVYRFIKDKYIRIGIIITIALFIILFVYFLIILLI